LAQKALDTARWAEVYNLSRREPGLSHRELGRRCGVDGMTAQKYRNRQPPEVEVPKPTEPDFSEDGNSATFEVTTEKRGRLDRLLKDFGVDLNIWAVERFACNEYESFAKVKEYDGPNKVIGERITVQPLRQIKAWLRRIVPVAVSPVVSPVEVRVTSWSKLPKRMSSRLKRCMVFPDIQCGFKRDLRTGELTPLHDRRAVDVALQIAEHVAPDTQVFLGDNCDLPDWSDKFLPSPEFFFTTQPTAVELAWIYGQARSLGRDIPVTWIAGNHDERFNLAVIKHLKQGYQLRPADDLNGPPLMSLERLLGLKSLGIGFVGPYPHGEVWLGQAYRLHHGDTVRGQSGKTTAAMAQDLRHNEGVGHIHRCEQAFKTGWTKEGPRVYRAESFGTLASIKPGLVPAFKSRNNWQNGTGWVDYEDGGSFSQTSLVPIYDGMAMADGRKFTARSEREIVAQIEADTKFNLRAA
jgi:hypothetical protein